MNITTQYALLATSVALVIAFTFFQPTNLVKWVQKKNYQYEVTFSLYMLTPTEKFVFNSILFLTLSMLTIASVVYLPNHIATISTRAYYYFAGDAALSRNTASQLGDVASKVADAVGNTAAAVEEAAGG